MRTILGRTYAEVLTVGTSPTPLDGGGGRPRDVRKSVLIGNGSGVVYLGGPDVNPTTGFPLAAGAQLGLDAAHGALYAVADASTTLNILEGY